MRRSRRLAVGIAVAVLLLGVAGTAQARDGGRDGGNRPEVIEVEDDCDPATFNVAIFPGACNPRFDGDTTAAEFFAEIREDGEVGKWRFHPDETDIDAGTSLLAINYGGEFHTFTPVEAFGGGCVPDPRLDIGEAPVAECANFDELAQTTGLPFRGRLLVTPTDEAVQLYQCLIHPWMRTTVEVEHGEHHHH